MKTFFKNPIHYFMILAAIIVSLLYYGNENKIESNAEGSYIGNAEAYTVHLSNGGSGNPTIVAGEGMSLFVSLGTGRGYGLNLPEQGGYQKMVDYYKDFEPSVYNSDSVFAVVNKRDINKHGISGFDLAWYNPGDDPSVFRATNTRSGAWKSAMIMDSPVMPGSQIYGAQLKALSDAGNLGQWKTLVNSSTKSASRALWAYFGEANDNTITETKARVAKYQDLASQYIPGVTVSALNFDQYTQWKDNEKQAAFLTHLDLLMTIYSNLADIPSAEQRVSDTIDQYVNTGFVMGTEGHAANIILFPGTFFSDASHKNWYLTGIYDVWSYAYKSSNDNMLASSDFKKIAEITGASSATNLYDRLYALTIWKYGNGQNGGESVALKNFYANGFSYVPNYAFCKDIGKHLTLRKPANTYGFSETLYLNNEGDNGINLIIAPPNMSPQSTQIAPFDAAFKTIWSGANSQFINVDGDNVADVVGFKVNLKVPDDQKATWNTILTSNNKFSILFNIKSNKETGRVTSTTLDGGATSNIGDAEYYVNGAPYAASTTSTQEVDIGREELRRYLLEGQVYNLLFDREPMHQAINLSEMQQYGYDLSVTIKYGDTDTSKGSLTSSWSGYSYDKTDGDRYYHRVIAQRGGTSSTPVITYYSSPEAFAEFKNGTVERNGNGSKEEWEAMAGIPSTETMYFTSGGSEFILEMELEFIEGEKATREYRNTFFGTECEFKRNDQFKASNEPGTAEDSNSFNNDGLTEWHDNFTGDQLGKDTTAELDKLSQTTYMKHSDLADSQTEEFGGHHHTAGTIDSGDFTSFSDIESSESEKAESTTLTASWSGTIVNTNTGENDGGDVITDSPKNDGYIMGGSKGGTTSCSLGTEYINNTGNPGAWSKDVAISWDTSEFKEKFEDAIKWAEYYEANEVSTDGYGIANKLADSDGVLRVWRPGKATIHVSLSNPSVGDAGPLKQSYTGGNYATGGTWGGTTYTQNSSGPAATTLKDLLAKANNATQSPFGSNKVYKSGKPSSAGSGDDAPEGSPPVPTCHHNYGSDGSYASYSARPDITFKITVTFSGGELEAKDTYTNKWIKGDGQYDGHCNGVSANGTLPAHALCGPCCQHDLPQILDTWHQDIQYDYTRINTMRVYKIHRSYTTGGDLDDITLVDYNESGAPGDLNMWWMHGAKSGRYNKTNASGQAGKHNGTDTLVAAISQGDPNIFYNIANEQPEYEKTSGSGKTAAMPSMAGRIRYGYQPQQYDWSYVENTTRRGNFGWADGYHTTIGSRSNKCDGLSKVTSSSNPAQTGGNGHKNRWSNGIIYNTGFSAQWSGSGDEYWMDDIYGNLGTAEKNGGANGVQADASEGAWPTYAVNSLYENTSLGALDQISDGKAVTGYNGASLALTIDYRNSLTEEYARFKHQRNQKTTARIISDMLILQTSTGDQPVMYYQTAPQVQTCQKHFVYEANKGIDIGHASHNVPSVNQSNDFRYKVEDTWLNNPNCAKNWGANNIGQDGDVNVGSYTGEFETPDNKFSSIINGYRFQTIYDMRDDNRTKNLSGAGGGDTWDQWCQFQWHPLFLTDSTYGTENGNKDNRAYGANTLVYSSDSTKMESNGGETRYMGRNGYEGIYASDSGKWSFVNPSNAAYDSVENYIDETEVPESITKAVKGRYKSSPNMCFTNSGSHGQNFHDKKWNAQIRMNRVNGMRIFTDNILQNPTNPNAEYDTGVAHQTYILIKDYNKSKNFVHKFNKEPVYALDLDDGKTVDGFEMEAPYSRDHDKINNIVVHDPVSAENATIVASSNKHDRYKADDDIYGKWQDDFRRDTRTENNLLGAENLVNRLNELDKCPRDAELCEFRVLNCSYGHDEVLANFDFSKATATKDGSVRLYDNIHNVAYAMPSGWEIDHIEQGGTKDSVYYTDGNTSAKLEANGNYTKYIDTNLMTVGGYNKDLKLTNVWFPSSLFGGAYDNYVKATGGKWRIPLSSLGLSTYDPATKLAVEMNFYKRSASDTGTVLAGFNNYAYIIPSNSKLAALTTGNGAQKTLNNTNFLDQTMKIKMVFDFHNPSDSKFYINGKEVTNYSITSLPGEVNSTNIGDSLYIGGWGRDNSYQASFYFDNLKITKLAGGREHTDACYSTIMDHTKTIQYTCQTYYSYKFDELKANQKDETGEPYMHIVPTSGKYKLEVFGAQGGGADTGASSGGLGGYTYGYMHLNKGQKLLMYPGGRGKAQTEDTHVSYFWILPDDCGLLPNLKAASNGTEYVESYINSYTATEEHIGHAVQGIWATEPPASIHCDNHSLSPALGADGKPLVRIADTKVIDTEVPDYGIIVDNIITFDDDAGEGYDAYINKYLDAGTYYFCCGTYSSEHHGETYHWIVNGPGVSESGYDTVWSGEFRSKTYDQNCMHQITVSGGYYKFRVIGNGTKSMDPCAYIANAHKEKIGSHHVYSYETKDAKYRDNSSAGWNGGGAAMKGAGAVAYGGGGASDIRVLRYGGIYAIGNQITRGGEFANYGPYIEAGAGHYQADIYGTNLDKTDFDVYSNAWTEPNHEIAYDDIFISPTHVTIYFTLDAAHATVAGGYGLEVRTFDKGGATVNRLYISRLEDRVIVAGGGGGGDNDGGILGGSDDGRGGAGGGSNQPGTAAFVEGVQVPFGSTVAGFRGQKSTLDPDGDGYWEAKTGILASGCGQGGQQTNGYRLGIGESASYPWDVAGAGGGYYGGYVTNHNNGGAGGGSAYVDTSVIENGTFNGSTGTNSGNGVCTIHMISHEPSTDTGANGTLKLMEDYNQRDGKRQYKIVIGGMYELEVWGANGSGGPGGYTSGRVYLAPGQIIDVYTGKGGGSSYITPQNSTESASYVQARGNGDRTTPITNSVSDVNIVNGPYRSASQSANDLSAASGNMPTYDHNGVMQGNSGEGHASIYMIDRDTDRHTAECTYVQSINNYHEHDASCVSYDNAVLNQAIRAYLSGDETLLEKFLGQSVFAKFKETPVTTTISGWDIADWNSVLLNNFRGQVKNGDLILTSTNPAPNPHMNTNGHIQLTGSMVSSVRVNCEVVGKRPEDNVIAQLFFKTNSSGNDQGIIDARYDGSGFTFYGNTAKNVGWSGEITNLSFDLLPDGMANTTVIVDSIDINGTDGVKIKDIARTSMLYQVHNFNDTTAGRFGITSSAGDINFNSNIATLTSNRGFSGYDYIIPVNMPNGENLRFVKVEFINITNASVAGLYIDGVLRDTEPIVPNSAEKQTVIFPVNTYIDVANNFVNGQINTIQLDTATGDQNKGSQLLYNVELYGYGNANKIGTVALDDHATQSYGYTGNVQEFVAPETAEYLLQGWGASGGDGVGFNQGAGSHAGLGGYAAGYRTLNKGEKIYVYVGGVGTYSTGLGVGGGYNGGGHGGPGGYGGGGMTHFSLTKNPSTTAGVDDVPISGQQSFDFTGYVQEFTAPITGTYTFKLYGASGGDGRVVNNAAMVPNSGGAGAYAEGTKQLNRGDKIYIYVGGKGEDANTISPYAIPAGGFNGGGTGGTELSGEGYPENSAGGGGASDIRIGGTSLDNRVIVAAGGGGAGSHFSSTDINADSYEKRSLGGAGGVTNGADAGRETHSTGGAQTGNKSGKQLMFKAMPGKELASPNSAKTSDKYWIVDNTSEATSLHVHTGYGGVPYSPKGSVTTYTVYGDNLGNIDPIMSTKATPNTGDWGGQSAQLVYDSTTSDGHRRTFTYHNTGNDQCLALCMNYGNGAFQVSEVDISIEDGTVVTSNFSNYGQGQNGFSNLQSKTGYNNAGSSGGNGGGYYGGYLDKISSNGEAFGGAGGSSYVGGVDNGKAVAGQNRGNGRVEIKWSNGKSNSSTTVTTPARTITLKDPSSIPHNQDFGYTGKIQQFTAPMDNYYTFEAWGASGAGQPGQDNIIGQGGYTKGTTYLKAGQTVYIQVGEKGKYIEKAADPTPAAKEFGYTGNVQEYTIPQSGYYKLEAWGAQGGTGYNNINKAGKGGYTAGTAYFTEGTKLYVYVGEYGVDYNNSTVAFNGGGAAFSGSIDHKGGRGGGASDIRLIGGAWNDSNGLRSRILVAGGGGGAQSSCGGQASAGAGGGLTGGTSFNLSYSGTSEVSKTKAYSTGGSQTAGGRGYCVNDGHTGFSSEDVGGFGYGANSKTCASGGGGGYYGGGSAYTSGGGGGSSYAAGQEYCDRTYAQYQGGYIMTKVTMKQGVQEKYGKVVISWDPTANNGSVVFNYTGTPQKFVADKEGDYKLEAWGAQGGGNDPTSEAAGSRAGKGGHTSGIVHLKKGQTLYVYVGGKGQLVNNWTEGGWNGGGGACYTGTALGTGGGATDFRLVGGAWNNTEGLQSRILVAGGGGGSDDTADASGSYHARVEGATYSVAPSNDNDESGGWGGGLNGSGALTNGYEANYGGGTQHSGGQASSGGVSGGFGFGGGTQNAGDYGGGGGGYYGGASGGGYFQGGAGGSSYVTGYTGCDTTYRSKQGGFTFDKVQMQQGTNAGNGRAKITLVGDDIEVATGTYNGGGDGGASMPVKYDNGSHLGGSGGGATDFRIVAGTATDKTPQWADKNSLRSRILVAGGGGGAGCASSHNPGNGGGLTGATTVNTGYYKDASSTGGTQTEGGHPVGPYVDTYSGYTSGTGEFGIGANAWQCGAGGGGGYYGGGSGYTSGGGGGSSYVSGYAGCDTSYLSAQGGFAFTNVEMRQGGNVGDGKARVSWTDNTPKDRTVSIPASTKTIDGMLTRVMPDGTRWARILYQDLSHNTNYFSSSNEAEQLDSNLPGKFSALGELERFRKPNGTFEFMLDYPDATGIFAGKHNRWIQSTNPFTEQRTNGGNSRADAVGYKAVDVQMDVAGIYGHGLERNGEVRESILDGSVNHSNWWLAVGQLDSTWDSVVGNRGFTPGPISNVANTPTQNVSETELWVRVDDCISTIEDNNKYWNPKGTLLVAGGGGGADNAGGAVGGGDDGSGGAGGGLEGGEAYVNGKIASQAPELTNRTRKPAIVENHGGSGLGGTQNAGFIQGSGESVTCATDTGGAGAGWYGGFVSNDNNGGGAGGSSYIGGVSSGTTSAGQNAGNGRATVTMKRYIPPVLTSYGPGATVVGTKSSASAEDVRAVIDKIKKMADLEPDQIPDAVDGYFNPLFDCNRLYNRHSCKIGNCHEIKILSCTEPHHYGGHYETNDEAKRHNGKICYDPCYDDSKHRIYKEEFPDLSGGTTKAEKYINHDEYFDIFFPNMGDFYESDLHGIPEVTQTRGMSYENDMDTSYWTREKYVKFDVDVLFYREETGLWEQYPADNWIELPVMGHNYPYYHFYCTLNNAEKSSASVTFESEAINADDSVSKYNYKNWAKGTPFEHTDLNGTRENFDSAFASRVKAGANASAINIDGTQYSKFNGGQAKYNNTAVDSAVANAPHGAADFIYANYNIFGTQGKTASNHRNDNDGNPDMTNKDRFVTYRSYHGASKKYFYDVVGRIGNLFITDTDDPRYSNVFKIENPNGNWVMQNLIREVFPDKPNYYLAWYYANEGGNARDVRNRPVANTSNMYNTWDTQLWNGYGEYKDKNNQNRYHSAYRSATYDQSVALPVESNSSKSKKANAVKKLLLKPGYNVFFEITTTGNYQDKLNITPYYYALCVNDDPGAGHKRGDLIPVDVYMNSSTDDADSVYVPINLFGETNYTAAAQEAFNGDGKNDIFSYDISLEWNDEKARRMFMTDEPDLGENKKGLSEEDMTKNLHDMMTRVDENGATEHLTIPGAVYYSLGNTQLLTPDGNARTFIGTSRTVFENTTFNGRDDTNFDNRFGSELYNYRAQRWHLKLGLPTSAVFTFYDGNKHIQPLDKVNYEGDMIPAYQVIQGLDDTASNYAIVMTANIKSIGSPWNLAYEQNVGNGDPQDVHSWSNGTVTISGNTFNFGYIGPSAFESFGKSGTKVESPDEFRVILALYTPSSSSEVDYDIIGVY